MVRFKNEKLRWDDLRLFLAVARSGGLAPATSSTDVSPATLGRRMLSLEGCLGATLFERHPEGYALTPEGEELIRYAETLEQGAFDIERWRTEMDTRPTVRIAAGAWTSTFISRHVAAIAKPEEQVNMEILTDAAVLDLSYREANLGIRNRRPYRTSLSGHRLGLVAFAIYGTACYVNTHPNALNENRYEYCDWVALSPAGKAVPSSTWLEGHLNRPAKFRCSMPAPLLDATIAGFGLCVLPCFIGDAESRLVRVSDTIDVLSHEQWLVCHSDNSDNVWIQRISKRLRKLFQENKRLFSGQLV